MTAKLQSKIYGIPYNIFLITLGAFIFGVGLKGIAMPHGLITGGISGLCLLIYYWTGLLSPGVMYVLLNIPIFILAWRFVSRRFFFYSLYGTTVLTLAIDLVNIQLPVHDPMMAAMAGGCLIGAGSGIILHSLGSAGGNDVVAVILNSAFQHSHRHVFLHLQYRPVCLQFRPPAGGTWCCTPWP